MCRHAGFRWGGRAAGTHSRVGSVRRRCGPRERVCFCRVFSLSVSLLFLFPSVCCSVKMPLSRPTSFSLFLSILLRTPAGGGAAAWRFCCRQQPKPKHLGSAEGERWLLVLPLVISNSTFRISRKFLFSETNDILIIKNTLGSVKDNFRKMFSTFPLCRKEIFQFDLDK